MSWTADETATVTRALIGSWPQTVAAWGREAIGAYVGELKARGLGAEGVLIAIRSWPAGSDFPPSAPNLAAVARKDPGLPTFGEALQLIQRVISARTQVRKPRWDLGERDRLDEQAMRERAQSPDIHPSVTAFLSDQGGPAAVRALGLFDDENPYRDVRRRELADAWDAFLSHGETRQIAALISPDPEKRLRQLDPLAALRRLPTETVEAAS